MRISKLFTCVIAALVLMYGSGCSNQKRVGQYQMIPGYGYVPAGAVVDPNTGFVTYPQTYTPGTTVYDPAVYTAPVYAPATVAPAAVKPRKVKQRRKVRYNRRNTRFANVNYQYANQSPVQYANQGYYVTDPAAAGYTATYTNPGYGTATLLNDPNVVPSITTAPVYAGPVYSDPVPVASAPVPTGPTYTVTKYAATSAARQKIAQVAGTACAPVYRRGRRVKVAKTPTIPYTTVAPTYTLPYAPTYTVPYTGTYTEPVTVYTPSTTSSAYSDPILPSSYTPQPLPVEPEPAPAAPAPVVTPPAPAAPVEKVIEVTVKQPEPAEPVVVSKPIIEPTIRTVVEPTTEVVQQPIVQPILIQPIIQPIIQSPIQQYAEPAPMPAPVQTLPPVQAPLPLPLPEPMPAPYMQAPIVSEPLSAMVSVPGAVGSGFEPGVMGSYCPPDICPVPNPVVCAPGQNLSECFTMNDYQLQNTPVQVLRPDISAPLSFPPAGTTIMSTPTPSESAQADTSKYQALTPPANVVAEQSVRPDVRRPEVSMPAPIGGTNMPPVPATTEIESALDAMLSRDARTPNLK